MAQSRARTMDWREDPLHQPLHLPAGRRASRCETRQDRLLGLRNTGRSRPAGYDIGITRTAMNESRAGSANRAVPCPSPVYERPGDTRPVHEGVRRLDAVCARQFRHRGRGRGELSKEKFRIDAPDLPNGVQSRLHLRSPIFGRQARAIFRVSRRQTGNPPRTAVVEVMYQFRPFTTTSCRFLELLAAESAA